ncbi:hypothetical protein Tco_0060112 [Tanacetum coccineum]
MYYPRFTKVIINHFMSKDQSIPRRNKVDWLMANNDPILTIMRFIPKHETIQKYGAIISDTLTNQAMKESDAYKTYHDFATGKNEIVTKGARQDFLALTIGVSKDDDDNEDYDGQDDDNEQIESDNDGDDFVHPKFSTHDEEERQDEEDKEEEGSDLRVHTPSHFESTDDETYDKVTQGDNVEGEELDEEETNEEEEVNELYRDMNANLERRDTEMTDDLQTNIQGTQVIEDTHVIITAVTPEVQQQSSSVSSGFISNMLNPNPDTGIDSILNLNTESTSLVDVPVTTNVEMPPSSVTTLPPPPIPLFEDRVKALEDDFSEVKKTNQFAKAVSSIPGIVDKYLANQMNEGVKLVVQLQSYKLRSEAQANNEDFINKIHENMKKIIKEQVKEQISKILPRIKKSVNEQLKAEVLIHSSNEAKTSHVVAANLSELDLKKLLIDKMKNNKSINRSVQQKNLYKALVDAYETNKDILETYGDNVMFKRRQDYKDEDKEPSAGSNRGSKRKRAGKEPESTSAPKEKTSKSTGKSKEGSKSYQTSIGKSVQVEEPIHADEDLEEPAHQEFDTGFTEDQPVDETTQHPDWFHSKILVELEYFLEEVCKATTDQLDWNNSEGQQYPHDLRKPLPSIPNLRGHRVIPFDHFINNEIAYLSGRVSSKTYATSVTKTKAADYGYIKWIEDLVPNTMWSQVPIIYDKHAFWGISHWGRKRQQFYGYAINRESACDYNRLRLQDIKDMLLLLVQGKLTNLNIEERLALGVSLRMFTRSIVIRRRVEDLQLGHKDKKNRLMRIDELDKFSDDTLKDVRSALDDILKNRRLMRSLEKIVGGRLYEGDLQLLERTI